MSKRLIEQIENILNEKEEKLIYKDNDVFLGKKHVGTIKKVKNGFQYVPVGQPQGGTVFKTIDLVKRSLD